MTTLSLILLIAYIGGILSLVWNLIKSIALVRDQRTLPAAPADARKWPILDIFIPVKDEAATINQCLKSVTSQDYPHTNILVVNDRSTDATAEAVAAFQQLHPLVRRVDIQSLPPGMYGKPHALHSVANQLSGELVAFVDSDLHLQPHCLRTLAHCLLDNNLDWVATMGKPGISRFWESLLVPILGAISFAWYDPRKISDPKWPNAIGSALMVCRRSSYEAIGGHGCVINAYDEDSELIRIAKRAGQRVSFVLTPELFTQRHYGTLKRTIHGITRTFIGGLKTIPRILFTINALNFISLLPLGLIALLGIASACGTSIPYGPYWINAAVVHMIVSLALALVIFRTADVPLRLACLHPLGSAVMIGICLRAAVHLHRNKPITWRGTTY